MTVTLRELIEKWEGGAERLDIDNQTDYGRGRRNALELCAADLREVVGDCE